MPDVEKDGENYVVSYEAGWTFPANPFSTANADVDRSILEGLAERSGQTFDELIAKLDAGAIVHIDPQTGK